MTEPKGMANYKGVMLCNRPTFDANVMREKPFVSRVDKKELLGINPITKVPLNRPRKYVNTAILKHKIWLEEFKKKVKEEKANPELKSHRSAKTLKKSSSMDFERQKEEIEKYFEPTETKIPEEKEENRDLLQNPEEKDPECEGLIDFMKNLDYDEFIQDFEVKSIINSLKQKITENKSAKVAISEPEKPNSKEQKPVKNPPNPEDWDKNLKIGSQAADTETRLAKYIASEILRNEKLLAKVHSNASVRKIIEMEKPTKKEQKG